MYTYIYNIYIYMYTYEMNIYIYIYIYIYICVYIYKIYISVGDLVLVALDEGVELEDAPLAVFQRGDTIPRVQVRLCIHVLLYNVHVL